MVLEDHARKKRKLVPPALAAMGDNYSPYSWVKEIVPEFFWIAKLILDYGPQTGVETARTFGMAASKASKKEPKPLFAAASSFMELDEGEQTTALDNLPNHELELLQHSLGPVSAVWQDSPLAFLNLNTDLGAKEALQELAPMLEQLYERHSREATLAISTLVYLGLDQEKIFINKEILERRATVFTDIERYPETEESRSAGSFFRAMAPMFLQMQKQNESSDAAQWQGLFWEGVSELGDCIGLHQDLPKLPSATEGYEGFIAAYSHFAHDDLRRRQEAWPLDLQKPQGQQVILALLARQATLAIETISAPSTWNPNVGPILMRAMADAHITLVWLLGDIENRVPLYVNDGLGAIKLEIAHREDEAKLNPDTDTEEQRLYTEHLRHWLESQQMSDFTEVNLGSWSGKNTRIMADESGCKNFYNFVFQPFSSAVHSHWSHVGRLNVEACQNPSHAHHFLPAIHTVTPDTHWCNLAAKYLAKSLDAFDEFIGRDDLAVESYSVARDAINQFSADQEK